MVKLYIIMFSITYLTFRKIQLLNCPIWEPNWIDLKIYRHTVLGENFLVRVLVFALHHLEFIKQLE